MKAYLVTLILTLWLFPSVTTTSHRRILHQPLFPATSTPPPPPSPPTSDNPFFHKTPVQQTPDQPQTPPPPPSDVAGLAESSPISPAPANKSGKKLAVVISVGIVTLGMLSGLAFFIYKHKSKQQIDSRKLVGGRHDNEDLAEIFPPARFLYVGTVESSTTATESINGSPYNKLNSVKTFDRYRPSPDLQPLPPLSKLPAPAPAMASDEDGEIHDFYTPHRSNASTDEGHSVHGLNLKRIHLKISSPSSKRSSPRSRLSVCSSPDSTSENPHLAISPAKLPPPLLHTNQSQQKPKIPIPPQPPPIKSASMSPAAKVIPKIKKPTSSLYLSNDDLQADDGSKPKLKPPTP